jgi:hypothetical protein
VVVVVVEEEEVIDEEIDSLLEDESHCVERGR